MAKALTAVQLNAAQPSSDGRDVKLRDTTPGLMLVVKPSGAKSWTVRVTVRGGKRREIGLGPYPSVGLAEARRKALEAARAAREGVDPVEAQQAAVAARRAAEAAREEAATNTFKAVALKYIESQRDGWKSDRAERQWRGSLELHAFPVLGDMPVSEIDKAAVMKSLAGVWPSKAATAQKIIVRIAMVLRYAEANGLRSGANPADFKLLRMAGMPALPAAKGRPALPWQRMPAFMTALGRVRGKAAICLRFTILTALRSGEARGALWSDLRFDDEAPMLVIPGERMKGRKSRARAAHRVPLSEAALRAICDAHFHSTGTYITLADLPRIAPLQGNTPIFRAARGGVLSDMALSEVVRGLNEKGVAWTDLEGTPIVVHGFRASFRTWVSEVRPADSEAGERALAHEEASKTVASYARSDFFGARIALMQAWADHCKPTATDGVEIIPLSGGGIEIVPLRA